jgi:hypothetical protein
METKARYLVLQPLGEGTSSFVFKAKLILESPTKDSPTLPPTTSSLDNSMSLSIHSPSLKPISSNFSLDSQNGSPQPSHFTITSSSPLSSSAPITPSFSDMYAGNMFFSNMMNPTNVGNPFTNAFSRSSFVPQAPPDSSNLSVSPLSGSIPRSHAKLRPRALFDDNEHSGFSSSSDDEAETINSINNMSTSDNQPSSNNYLASPYKKRSVISIDGTVNAAPTLTLSSSKSPSTHHSLSHPFTFCMSDHSILQNDQYVNPPS